MKWPCVWPSNMVYSGSKKEMATVVIAEAMIN